MLGMATSHSDTEWLDQSDLEALTGVPARTWGQWRYLGNGPRYYRIGRHVRYRRCDVETWLEARAVEPAKVG